MLDHVGQGFLTDAVELLLDLGSDGQVPVGPVDLDGQPFPGAERRRLLGERGDQPLLGERAGLELEDEGAHLGQRAPGQLADLAQLLPHRPGGVELLELQRVLRGADMERGREQRLGDRVVQVAGDALSFKGATLTLAALRLGQLQRVWRRSLTMAARQQVVSAAKMM